MIVLDKYEEVNSIYGLTAKQTYMHTGLTIDQFIKQLSSSKTIDIKTIKAFERLFGINFNFFKRPSFIDQGLNMEYPFTEKYIIDQEKIYLLYAHYFYNVIVNEVRFTKENVNFKEFTKIHDKFKIQSRHLKGSAIADKNYLISDFKKRNLMFILEKMGVRILTRSLMKYGVEFYSIWIENTPYIVLDKHTNQPKYALAKGLYELLNKSNSKYTERVKQEAIKYGQYLQNDFVTYRYPQLIVSILMTLEKSYKLYTDSLMAKYDLNKQFLYKLFDFDTKSIKRIEGSA